MERYRYDSYGQRTVLAPDGVTTRAVSSYNQQIGFTGRYLDKETGLWYFRARYYSGTLGRFIGRDRFIYRDGFSLYGAYFVANYLDPYGWFVITGEYSTLIAQMPEVLGEAKYHFEGIADPPEYTCICTGEDAACPDLKKYKCQWKGKIKVSAVHDGTEVPQWHNRKNNGRAATLDQVMNWLDFVEAVTKHEQGHHDEADLSAKDYNAQAKEHSMESLEGCNKAASDDIITKMNNAVDDAIKEVNAIDEERQQKYHKKVGETINPGDYLK